MYSQHRENREVHKKVGRNRTIVCAVAFLACISAFAVRLADWQLVQGEKYKELATRSTSYTVETEATRGEILDCNGVGLVVNTTRYRVVLDKLYVDAEKLDATILSLISLVEKTGDKWEDKLPIKYENGGYSYITDEKAIETLFSLSGFEADKNITAAKCVEKLKERYKIKTEYTPEQLRNLLSVYYNMELCSYSNSTPYCFATDISTNAVAVVSENTQGVSGVEVVPYSTRAAVDADIAPHILGALGSLTSEEYEKVQSEGKEYALSDSIGKFGIELACEDILKGKGGTKIVKKNSDGTVVDTVQTIDAQPGNTIYLTLDSKLQAQAVKSLAENVKAAKKQGQSDVLTYGGEGRGEDCEAGAVVMLSVKDFSVLAAASYPTYDLNKYSEYGDYYVKLTQNENSPMYNRAFVGTFASGSVYKPLVACAALEEKVVGKDEKINCTQKYDYYKKDVVNCMHYHSFIDMNAAITESCNFFFAESGRRLGIDTTYLYAQKFGLGEYTGVEIEESRGILAGRDSEHWVEGNTVQAAIGQSDNSFTPLQLATYVATIANDGTRLKTHLVDKVTNYERNKVISETQPEVIDTCGVSQENLEYVQAAMLNVTQSSDGTAYSMFGDYKVKVAAKTGTAENAGSDHATFICYAPYDDPEVAIAVVVENGARGRYSMQIAKDLLDVYFQGR